MNEKIKYALIAVFILVVIYFVFLRNRSNYDTDMFPDSMTEDEAAKKVEEETQRISNEYTEKLNKVFTEEEKNNLAKMMESEVSKLSNDYNEFMIKKTNSI